MVNTVNVMDSTPIKTVPEGSSVSHNGSENIRSSSISDSNSKAFRRSTKNSSGSSSNNSNNKTKATNINEHTDNNTSSDVKSKISRNSKRKQQVKGYGDMATTIAAVLVIAITIFTCPTAWDTVTAHHVWYYGWITAISTGVGVFPFFVFSEPDKYWMAVSNALAGGMMIAASYSLISEGINYEAEEFGILAHYKFLDKSVHPTARTICGAILGVLFIQLTKKLLNRYEDLDIMNELGMGGHSAQKMILIVFVMTLHSITEGVGIGVSFGGRSGMQLGRFISMSLAVHNVPEGLAVGLVLTARKTSKLKSVLWAIFTSLPQPIFAIPAFFFVERFAPMLPAGLGFAAGAMAYVAVFELLSEAAEEMPIAQTGLVGTISCAAMYLMQEGLKSTS